ncbi:MAG: hypothetical protein DMG49_05850 [Acidobacteria bacterium]|nr:MAG: hypothetical protein DMG49_05850 [Acidobacteriota bacterium]PYV89811.1 MAG: hypothetical protein DMG90_10375 [Acidobacteriota bacterium]
MKSFVPIFAAVTLCFLFGPITIQAHAKRASLPASAVAARTVYVDNQTTMGRIQNIAYPELSKWGASSCRTFYAGIMVCPWHVTDGKEQTGRSAAISGESARSGRLGDAKPWALAEKSMSKRTRGGGR